MPEVPKHAAKVPRIGVWVPWADTDSIGWVRYSLDQRKVPYMYLRDEDIRSGRLKDKIDVLLYGHVDLELAEQIQGIPKRWSPMAFKKRAQTPSLGTPAETEDITGGIGGGGPGEDSGVCGARRDAGYVGEWVDARAGRRDRERSAARFGRSAEEFARGRSGIGAGSASGGDTDTGSACAGDVRPTGSSDCVRL